MNVHLVYTALIFIALFLILGFFLKNRAGLSFLLTSSFLMMFLGIGIVASGIEIEVGEVTINATTDIIEIEPETQTFPWLDTTAGVGLLLLGIFLFVFSISNYNNKKKGYGDSEFKE